MRRTRGTIVILLGLVTLCWSASAMLVHQLQLKHETLVSVVHESGEPAPNPSEVKEALSDYQSLLALLPCHAALQREYNLLRAYHTDATLAGDDIAAMDDALTEMHHALSDTLICTPTDGKAWLDFSFITLHREGFTTRTLDAYTMSARVSPGESWLAEKRLYFALTFKELLDDNARKIALRDIVVLERAHPNRMEAVMNVANVTTPQALKTLFKS